LTTASKVTSLKRQQVLHVTLWLLLAGQWQLLGCGPNGAQVTPTSKPTSASNDPIADFGNATHIFTVEEAVVTAPVVSDGQVIVRTHSKIEAFALGSGKKQWSYSLAIPTRAGRMWNVPGKQIVLATEGTSGLCAIDIISGCLKWRKEGVARGVLSPTPVATGAGLCVVGKSEVLLLDMSTGRTIWTAKGVYSAAPVPHADHLVILDGDGPSIGELDLSTGHATSRVSLQFAPLMESTAYSDRIYYHGFRFVRPKKIEKAVVCLDIKNKKAVWVSPIDDKWYFASLRPTLHEGHIYWAIMTYERNSILGARSRLQKVDIRNGDVVWAVDSGYARSWSIDMIWYKGMLLFSDGSSIVAVSDRTGKPMCKWTGKVVSQIGKGEGVVVWADGAKVFVWSCPQTDPK